MKSLDTILKEEIQNIEKMLTNSDGYLQDLVDIRGLMESHRKILIRLRLAERFCVAAKALAEYKKPLESVLNSLDAWERVAWGNQFKKEIEDEENKQLDNSDPPII